MGTNCSPASDEALVLPFFSRDIPATLPSGVEIESPDEVLSECLARKVVRIGSHFVVKYGHTVEVIEAEAVMFVRKMTSIPVPKVFAIYKSESSGMLYIVMEYIQGSTLLEEWQNISEPGKAEVMNKLKEQLDLSRDLPAPGYFGSIGRRRMPSGIFWTGGDDE